MLTHLILLAAGVLIVWLFVLLMGAGKRNLQLEAKYNDLAQQFYVTDCAQAQMIDNLERSVESLIEENENLKITNARQQLGGEVIGAPADISRWQ